MIFGNELDMMLQEYQAFAHFTTSEKRDLVLQIEIPVTSNLHLIK